MTQKQRIGHAKRVLKHYQKRIINDLRHIPNTNVYKIQEDSAYVRLSIFPNMPKSNFSYDIIYHKCCIDWIASRRIFGKDCWFPRDVMWRQTKIKRAYEVIIERLRAEVL